MARSIGRALGIGLSANTDKFSKGLKNAETDLEKFKRGVKRMGMAAAAGFAALGVAAIAYGKQAVDAYNQDLKSQTRLQTALKNTKKATDGQIKSLEKLITKQQLKYGVSDTNLRAGYQKLITATHSITKSHRLMSIALDVSAGTGKDLETVTGALAKGYLGNAGALGRLGAGLDKATIKSGNMEKITKRLAEIHNGQASKAAGTYEGKVRILNEKLGEFKENVGAKLIGPLTTLVGYIESAVVPKLQAFFDGVTKGKKPLDEASQSAYDFGQKVRGFVGYLKDNTGIVKGFAAAVAAIWVVGKVSAAVSAIGTLINAYKALRTSAAITAVVEAFATAGVSVAPGLVASGAVAAGLGVAALSIAGLRKPKTEGKFVPKYGSVTKDVGHGIHGGRGGAGNRSRKAVGGPVQMGQAYLVGERGPEMFVPNGQSGRITPNHQLGGNNITFNLNGIVDADSARRAIEDVLRNSAKRLGPVNLIGSAL